MKTKMIKIKPQYFLLTLLWLALLGCDTISEESQQVTASEASPNSAPTKLHLTEEQFKNAGIELGEIEKKTVSNTLKVNGMIDVPPQNLISIAIPMGGFVKNTDMLQGIKVKRGEVLATIENPDFIQLQQDYLDTQSKLEYAQAEYERQVAMQKEQVTSDKAVQQTTADYKSLQTRLKALEQHLKLIGISIESLKKGNISNNINILAPINGYVTTVNVNIGKHVSPAEVLFEIVNTDHLHAELNVFEKDVPLLKIGQKVRVMVGNENHEHEGSIFLINHKINDDRTVNVHVHFDDKGEDLMPKSFLSALIEIENQSVEVLPNDAFTFSEGEEYIFVYVGKTKANAHEFEMVKVKKGVSQDGFTQLISLESIDLKAKKIAVKGGFTLIAKLKNVGEEE